jgi:hypothetical protein
MFILEVTALDSKYNASIRQRPTIITPEMRKSFHARRCHFASDGAQDKISTRTTGRLGVDFGVRFYRRTPNGGASQQRIGERLETAALGRSRPTGFKISNEANANALAVQCFARQMTTLELTLPSVAHRDRPVPHPVANQRCPSDQGE